MSKQPIRFCLCFFPYKEPYKSRYRDTYKPLIKSAGLLPVRIDELILYGDIPQEVNKFTKAAAACVVDISAENTSVGYEMCFADTHNIPMILVGDEKPQDKSIYLRNRMMRPYPSSPSEQSQFNEWLVNALKLATLEHAPTPAIERSLEVVAKRQQKEDVKPEQSPQAPVTHKIKKMHFPGFHDHAALTNGMKGVAPPIDMLANLPDIENLYDIPDLEKLYNISDIENLYDIPDLENLYDIPDLENLYDIPDLEKLYNISDLENLYDIPDLENLYNISDLENRYNIPDLENLYDIPDLENLYDIPDLEKLYNISDLEKLYDIPDLEKLYDIPDLDMLANLPLPPKDDEED